MLRNTPIGRKLTILNLLTAGAALLLATMAFVTYDQFAVRREMARELGLAAQMIGFNCASALAFDEASSAAQTLRGLSAQPHIEAACVYKPSGEVFAVYQRERQEHLFGPAPSSAVDRFGSDGLELFRPIVYGGEIIGTIALRCDLDDLRARFWSFIGIAGAIMAVATFAAYVIASRLQRVISGPILEVASIAERIAVEKNYSVRASKRSEDEVGRLIDGFNHMLTQIQARDADLQKTHAGLEKRVEERTEELRASEERIRLIVDTAFDAIITIDANGEIFGWNRQAETILGWTRDQATGQSFVDLVFPPEDRDAQRASLEQFRETDASPALNRPFECRALHQSGRVLPIELAISPIRDEETVILSAFMRDITERTQAAEEIGKVHRQLLVASRQAGMAEVATGVLHNVGNVLNSVNVSATLVSDRVRHSKAGNVAKVSALLDQHQADLPGFFANDAKGALLPKYLATLAEQLATEKASTVQELEQLQKNIEHIKEIVAMQQSYAKTSGFIETVSVPDLVEDALRMNAGSLARHDVDLRREYHARPVITLDKHKVIQILINLVRNAKYACDESGRVDKMITVRTDADETSVRISVTDNGVGIAAENLIKIFGHGFTTRKQGHGFGLHSGALAAKELGGSLRVESAGPGHGATFVLQLPYKPEPVLP